MTQGSTVAAGRGTARRPAWHALTPEDALAEQGVDPAAGLTGAEVEARRAKFGAEQVRRGAPRSRRWRAFLRQYRDPMQIVLLVAGIVSLFLPGPVRAPASC